MLPLNHKRTTSSLAPPIFYVAKNLALFINIFLIIKKFGFKTTQVKITSSELISKRVHVLCSKVEQKEIKKLLRIFFSRGFHISS